MKNQPTIPIQDALEDAQFLIHILDLHYLNQIAENAVFRQAVSDDDSESIGEFTNSDLDRLCDAVDTISLWCDLGNCGVDPSPLITLAEMQRRIMPLNDGPKVTFEFEVKQEFKGETERLWGKPTIRDGFLAIRASRRVVDRIRRVFDYTSNSTSPTHSDFRVIELEGKSYKLTPRAARIARLIMETSEWKLDFSEAQLRFTGNDTYDENDLNTWAQWRGEFNKVVAESGYKMSVSRKNECFQIIREFETD